MARARQGEPAGLAVRARRQSAGRGSRGRDWQSLEGNLALSVLLRPGGDASGAGRWALAGAVALHAGLSRFVPGLVIKWPNDVQQAGRKAAGLLVDASVEHGAIEWVVVGLGANLLTAPAGGAPPPVALGAHEPGAVAGAVLDALSDVCRTWRDEGFPGVRARWLAAAHPVGTPLRVRNARLDVSGTFAGLTDDGALLLATAEGVRTFSTGEVLLQ